MNRKDIRAKMKQLKREWRPPMFGERHPDEVVCYGFGIPYCPFDKMKKMEDFVKYVGELEGFLGFYPDYRGVVLIFDNENNAKGGRNLIRVYPGFPGNVGEIEEVFVKKEYLER